MNTKLFGALFVTIACSVAGFYMAASIKTEVKNLEDLIKIIKYMECELNYRLTPLASLCKLSAEQGTSLKTVFHIFAEELEKQISPEPATCMDAAILRCRGLSHRIAGYLHDLGHSFGKFDLQGQLSEIQRIHSRCEDALSELAKSKDLRMRNCQTFGICIGIAMTIILL